MPFMTYLARKTNIKAQPVNRKRSAVPPPLPLPPPVRKQKEIGDYWLGKTIGRGASGHVKLGYHRLTGERVAIKVIARSQLATSNTMARCVQRELAVLQLLHHPHLVDLRQVLQDAHNVYFVMEYLEGGELYQLLSERGKMTEMDARHLFRQLVSGLAWCHAHHICHRDLKPENILLDKELKTLKIADFGMAILQSPDAVLKTSCGSPHYASPEIVKGKPYNGQATDIWSCGIILYAMLTGHLPFDDDNVSRLLAKIKTGRYVPLPSGVSREAKNLIKSMLVVDPTKRITLEAVLAHPWLTNKSFLGTDLRSPSVYSLAQKTHNPLHDQDLEQPLVRDALDLDGRVWETLKVLWRDMSQSHILAALTNDSPNLQKLTCKLLKQRVWRQEQANKPTAVSATSPNNSLISEDSTIAPVSPPLTPCKYPCGHRCCEEGDQKCNSLSNMLPDFSMDNMYFGRTMADLPPTPKSFPAFDLDTSWHSDLQKELLLPDMIKRLCVDQNDACRYFSRRIPRWVVPSIVENQTTSKLALPLVSPFAHAHATLSPPSSSSLSSNRTALDCLQQWAKPSRRSSTRWLPSTAQLSLSTLTHSVTKCFDTVYTWCQTTWRPKKPTKTFSFERQAKHECEAAGKLHQILEEHFDSKLSGRLYPSGQIMWSASMLMPGQERVHFLCNMSPMAPNRVKINLVIVQGDPSTLQAALERLLDLWNIYESESKAVLFSNGWLK